MSKAILISIKPKWVAKILNGEKTVEIRKTMPKCDLPIDVYIYCTKDKERLVDLRDDNFYFGGSERLNGKVVAKFTLKHIDNLSNHFTTPYLYTKETCLTWEEILNYRNNGLCYAWHISNLEIFDKPKELSEFESPNENENKCRKCPYYVVEDNESYSDKFCMFDCCRLTKAPQSWCYVEVE